MLNCAFRAHGLPRQTGEAKTRTEDCSRAIGLCTASSVSVEDAVFHSGERGESLLAITREKKAELLEEYKAEIQKASALVFTNYRGTSVTQLRSLRNKLGDTGTSYIVVKNSIFGLALEQLGRTKPDKLLAGPNGVAFITEDIGKSVTALNDWIKAEKVLEVTGALVESSVVDAAGAQALADLPTKEQTLAAILGTINAPASNLARILNAPSASLARVINARVEKMQEAAA